MKTDYRKIWEQHHGEIPCDETGRSYEIHHRDGNTDNNDINNLLCVSIQEHYDIHYSQQDYWAASMIMTRMNYDENERRKLLSLHQKRLIENGTHNMLNGKLTKWQLENGFHSTQQPGFSDKMSKIATNTNNKRVSDGTHSFVGGLIQKESNAKRLADGSHNFLKTRGTVPCIDKFGKHIRILSEEYKTQTGNKEQWEYVHQRSNEAQKRKGLNK